MSIGKPPRELTRDKETHLWAQSLYKNDLRWGNVMAYGADPSGDRDCTPAFNAAISDNDVIYIPPGDYLLSALDDITASKRITGAGRSSKLVFNSTGDCVTLNPASSLQNQTVHIDNLSFDNSTNTPSSFIMQKGFINAVLEKLYFSDTAATWCIVNEWGYGMTVRDSVFSDTTGSGIHLLDDGASNEYSYAISIYNCDFTRLTGTAISSEGGTGLVIQDTIIQGCDGNGLVLNSSLVTQQDQTTLINVWFESNDGDDIIATSQNLPAYYCSFTLIGCHFYNNCTIDLGNKSRVTIIGSVHPEAAATDLTIVGSSLAEAVLIGCGQYTQSGSFKLLNLTGERLTATYFTTLSDDATPSVAGGRLFETGGTTTITDFDDGYSGHEITVLAQHSVTITDGTNIFLSGSTNFDMVSGDTLRLLCFTDGKWYETGRGDN